MPPLLTTEPPLYGGHRRYLCKARESCSKTALNALGYGNGALSGQAYGPTFSMSGLSDGGSQVHSASAPAPASTSPGSLGFAGGVLLLFAACNAYVI